MEKKEGLKMKFNQRIRKIEDALDRNDGTHQIIVVLPHENEQDAIKRFEAENPGVSFDVLRVLFASPDDVKCL
ncbi:MAG: hypothetical protein M0036_12370 [Desulfobacteraceae bacterium]|nr:hypothetical protein [Desulfobacteraceae bacterium]